ncbi:MAG: gliding motility-associated C-terminal domain-containing protein [Bacteroidota bacterium]
MEITLTPQIAAETGNTGRISIVNTATNKVLYETQLSDVARRAIITPKVEGIVSATDLQAGNISILVALKSTGSNLWVANNLIVTYRSVLPTCPATQSLKVTINAIPTAPVTGGDQVVCATNPIQTLTAAATTDAGNTITWYDAATGGNIVVAPTLNTVGTKTYYAQSSNGTCTSLTRTAVTLTINASSVAPVSGGDQIICATDPIQTLTATATVDAGNTITWYDAAIGGNIVTMPVLNAVGIRTYYAEAGNGTCTSLTRTSVTLTINASPVAPVSGGDQVICAIDPIQTLTATATTDPGNAITWYDAAIGGNIVTAPTLNIVGTKTYYAEANNSTCTSLTRTAVTLTINASPIAPVSGGDQVVCASSPVQTLTATATVGAGNTLTWYDAAIAGNIVTAPTLNTIGTKTYYAETSNGTCTSLTRTPVTLTINATPVLRVTNPAPVCAGSTVDLTAPSVTLGSTVGLSYTYFTDAATTIPLTLPGQVAQTGTYYIKATSTAGCTTISPVNVFIVTVPEVTTVLPTCIIATGSLTVNSPLGAGIDYSIDGTNYQSATLFDNLPPGTYNVTARNQAIGCISPAKTVTINPNPTTGTPTVLQPDCDLATGTITFPVDAAYQYSINNGSTFVANNVFSALVPGTYTVRMKLIATSCIADAINVVIAAQPARPTTPVSGGDQVVCAATPIQTLTATATVSAGNTITWYDAATNGNVVSSPILNTIGTKTYYAETSNGTCTSLTRTAVTLTINATPVLIVTNPAPVCAGSTVDLTAPSVTLGSTVGLSYTYFTDAAATNPLTSPSAIAQTGTYYIKATSTAGCTTISPVNVFIVTVPEVTTVLPTCIIATGSLTVNSPLGAGIDYSIDGISYQSATLFDNLPPGTYNVTARNQAIGCISPAKTVTINPNATTGTPVVTQPDCNVATGTITFPVDASYQYSIDNGGTFAANNVFSALVPGTYIVRMKLIATSCIADAINVVIAAQPARPIAPVSGGDQVVCAATPIQTLTATATVGAGNTLTWYDAATGGNVVSNPTLNTIGTKIYYAESNNGTCTSLTRTGVTLTINANPIAIAGTPQTQSNSGVFTLGATSAIAGAIGSWSVVSGTPAVAVSDINDPNATMSLSPNTSVTLRWTVTTGSCSATDDVILTYTSSTLPSGGQVALVKTINNAGTGANGAFRQGDEIRYLFVVTNTGNLTLTNIVIKDPMISNQDISISGILAPGAPITYTANYKVTLADAAKGQVSNQAVVTTSDPNGKPVTDQSGTDLTNDVATTTVIENLSPKATNDSGSTESGKPISINVVTDDLAGSAPLDPSTIEIIDQPLHGTLTVNADGTVVYTSAKGYIGTDVFTYRVKDINGNWSNVASVTIILSKVTLTIPTLFSPNGDGVNDTFEIRGLELFTESELTIVNRWGNEVYRSSHYKNDWIGQGLNEGTYYYLLRVKANAGSEWQVFKGYTTLIRTFRK